MIFDFISVLLLFIIYTKHNTTWIQQRFDELIANELYFNTVAVIQHKIILSYDEYLK